jgi:hypothetical protein
MRRLFPFISALATIFTVPTMATNNVMTFTAIPPPKEMVPLIGTAWSVYGDGVIDTQASERFEALIAAKKIPSGSYLFLNSPGGSVIGGLALGRALRKRDFITYVGSKAADSTRDSPPGACMSACSLAFLGGRFRFLKNGSLYGVHRFSGPSSPHDSAVAQILSADIAAYIKEMGVETGLLALMATTDPGQIRILSDEETVTLGVVHDGQSSAKWTLEGRAEIGLYLKGEPSTYRGTDKFIFGCEGGRPIVIGMFVPPENRTPLMAMQVHSINLDGEPAYVPSATRQIDENYATFGFPLDAATIAAIKRARRIGVAAQMIEGAPIFAGFADMPTAGMAEKLEGFLKMCIAQ